MAPSLTAATPPCPATEKEPEGDFLLLVEPPARATLDTHPTERATCAAAFAMALATRLEAPLVATWSSGSQAISAATVWSPPTGARSPFSSSPQTTIHSTSMRYLRWEKVCGSTLGLPAASTETSLRSSTASAEVRTPMAVNRSSAARRRTLSEQLSHASGSSAVGSSQRPARSFLLEPPAASSGLLMSSRSPARQRAASLLTPLRREEASRASELTRCTTHVIRSTSR
mmetsp:Transcript_17590/g.47403  ORF Transcript_17590/g.47403 Transcript_17590/m.47403 type:complete len:229 (-) Transcript_17590:226-912(-)